MAKANLRFMGVDILGTMGSIVDAHTQFYKTDFYDVDVRYLRDAATKQERDDRCFLWLCRTHGTWLLNERSVFIRNTFEHNTFVFYADNHLGGVLAYAVEVTGMDGDTVIGNLYSLDYVRHAAHVSTAAITPERYEHTDTHFTTCFDAEYGELVSLSETQEDCSYLLRLERRNRNRFAMGNFRPYLATL